MSLKDSIKLIGGSREEGGETSLSHIKDEEDTFTNNKCPICGEGYVRIPRVSGSWGTPTSSLTSMCSECGEEFHLALVPESEL